ncbi:DedA family protein [uncultured Cetobacterium sp.]|uniref:DedA family protein n=1 Tax=uncultured Cetobacterium sp. TaxID=527638 RepID=UPI00261621BB|nr:DedA family protein [uncultured Cetobacterium sp.]
MEILLQQIADFFLSLGYLGIFIMMTLEASFIPFPSELALLPAGYLIGQGEMNTFIVLIVGTMGCIVGSSINYFLGAFFGRELILKHGKYLFLNNEKFKKMENLFKKKGDFIVFFGRFIPVIRQYISFPPGIVKMNYFKFITYTGIASGIYVSILVFIGYYCQGHKELINNLMGRFKILILIIVILAGIYFIIKKGLRNET